MTCVPDAVTHCQSDKHLAITSGDEVGACKSISIIIVYCGCLWNLIHDSIYLSESQETADAFSTPSSKRKEDETIEQDDLSSTSKKPCTRSIKIEMVEEANKIEVELLNYNNTKSNNQTPVSILTTDSHFHS
ncbi:hypothetical protein YC2023_016129 [Brassica napus]